MPFNVTSSVLGADFNNTSSTQLFALNTKVMGTNNTEWTYVLASGAIITGEMCLIYNGGTAVHVYSTTLATTGVGDFGWAQGNFATGEYGWLVRRGNNITVLMSSTCVPNTQLYWAPGQAMGALTTTAGSASMAGIQLNASSSTASLVLTTAIITWPRCKYNENTAQ